MGGLRAIGFSRSILSLRFNAGLQFDAFTTHLNGVDAEGAGQKCQFKELFRRVSLRSDPARYCLIFLELRNPWP